MSSSVVDPNPVLESLNLPKAVGDLLTQAKSVIFAHTLQDIYQLVLPGQADQVSVAYPILNKGLINEAKVCRVKNGIVVNYDDPYMRRRDPDCMLIGDNSPTDKQRFKDVYKQDFDQTKQETFQWLVGQDLLVFGFMAGQASSGIPTLVILPTNAAFFAYGLALLQGIVGIEKGKKFSPRCFIYVAPPFRHSHFSGKQVVVHCRLPEQYEIFSYNLYPGPSAKKGVYGALLHFGEQEGWVTNHAAVVQVITPYDNKITIMHEGASGGGKSEMNERIHRENDGSILFGANGKTLEKRFLTIPKGCKLRPVTDDMALAHPSIQKNKKKLTVMDAEYGWFIRVDHIKSYGTDPEVEALSIRPQLPLLFLNIDAQPGSTALLWEHIEDSPGKTCPNPRFIIPRKIVPEVVNKPVGVDIRSFGVRTPPCTADKPTYGILGIFHVLPPALAWLWRLVAPRGYDNPSIIDTEGMSSEGVGSYWPFATGLQVNHANLLLKQVIDYPGVKYVLCPVKWIGAWKVGFMPQWIMREYVARRGGVKFGQDELSDARCPLLGYALEKLTVEGQNFEQGFLKVEMQPEVGLEAYDQGALELTTFFKQELKPFLENPALDPLGKKIITCLFEGGTVENFSQLIRTDNIFFED